MNTVQRLLSNTVLAFAAGVVVKAGNALLFILIGRQLGPGDSGLFSLGTTFYTFVFGLSALGLTELMVRELAPRREESGRYLINYLALRLLSAVVAYGLLVAAVRFLLPYSAETNEVILILSLAVLPEAVFTICQALFEAHERFGVPLLASVASSGLKLAGGLWLLAVGATVTQIAWVVPIAGALSLLVFVPGIAGLLRRQPQRGARLDPTFLRGQGGFLLSFLVIQLFLLLDYQADAVLISLLLSEADLGYYTAAQTILLAFNLMPLAIRSALYPLMSRYYHEAPDKLVVLNDKVNRYLMGLALPLAAGVTLLAGPITRLVFGPAFTPAVAVLQIAIWAIIFLFLNVPHARLLLIYGRQRQAAWLLALSTGLNVVLNLIFIPLWGITGAAVARVLSSFGLYLAFYLYTHFAVMRSGLPVVVRPLLATLAMAAAVWPLRALPLPVPIVVGAVVYVVAALLLRVVPAEDVGYWRELGRRGV